jgi:hypothetical protein
VAPEAPRGLHPGGGAGPPGSAAVRAPRVQQDAHGEVRGSPLLCWFVFVLVCFVPEWEKGFLCAVTIFLGGAGRRLEDWVSAVALCRKAPTAK